MKRILVALLGLMTMVCLTACEKNEGMKPAPTHDTFRARDIIYIVNYGEKQQVHIASDAELDSLIDSFCDHLGSGHGNNITFYDADYANPERPSKETVSFTTSDREQLKAWMRQMEDEGKTVNVTYDAVNGIYYGKAYANLRVPTAGNQWVDLGLPSGLLWASCNVGASRPEDFGDYFAWAETTPKPEYNWDNYRYCHVDSEGIAKLTKYCKYDYSGYSNYSDTLTTLEACDDAATAYLGDDARTPTYYEWKELMDCCTFEWATENDVYGYRITGINGNSIFLPAANMRTTAYGHLSNDMGCYWSASLGLDYECGINDLTTYGWVFTFREGNPHDSRCLRYYGIPVRAVRSAR